MRSIASLTIACCWLLHGAAARAAPNEPSQEQQLRAEATRARTWRYVWSGVNAGLTVGAFVALPLDRREARPDWIVSGAGSGLSLLTTFFLPLRVESAVAELDALPPIQRAARLPQLYRESAIDERERASWPWHVANVGVSALAGGIIAFGYDHYVSGAITAAVSTSLGEAQLFTQPTRLGGAGSVGLRLVPRLAFTPRAGLSPPAWTLSLAGVL